MDSPGSRFGLNGGIGIPVGAAEPKTWNSHNEYPYPVARAVPCIRTYLAAPVTLSVWVPPVPVVVE